MWNRALIRTKKGKSKEKLGTYVQQKIYDSGATYAQIVSKEYAEEKGYCDGYMESNGTCDIYIDCFETLEEAREFIRETRNGQTRGIKGAIYE